MSNAIEEIKAKTCGIVLSKMNFADEMTGEEVLKLIDDVITSLPERKTLALDEILTLRTEVFNSIKRFDVIQEYLDDESVTEIMINGTDAIFVEKGGALIKTGKRFASEEKLQDVIQQIVGACNRTVNEAYPIAEARLVTGEGVNIVLSPVSLAGSTVTILTLDAGRL